jgi:hypothetical protein
MFRLLSPSRRRPVAAPGDRPVRLGLEALETRDCPSTLSMGVTYDNQNWITLSGQLTNTPMPGSMTVGIYGQASGSTTTDVNGNYSITLPASGVGNVYARTADGQSNVAQVTLTDDAPVIDNFQAIPDGGNFWTFSGHVTDQTAAGLVVNFGGLASLNGKTATTDNSGNFSLYVQLNGTPSDNGNAGAWTTDWYNMPSQPAMCSVYQT